MTANARRLAVSILALGTVALAACGGDPVSPKAVTADTQSEVFGAAVGRVPPPDTTKTTGTP